MGHERYENIGGAIVAGVIVALVAALVVLGFVHLFVLTFTS